MRSHTALLVVAVFAACGIAACGGGASSTGTSSSSSQNSSSGNLGAGPSSNDPCSYLGYAVGTSCTLSLAPYDSQEFLVDSPYTASQGLLTTSVTGSDTLAGVSVEFLNGTFVGGCGPGIDEIDASCDVLVEPGVKYRVVVSEGLGTGGTTTLTTSTIQNIGLIDKPIPVSEDSQIIGTVAGDGSSYFSFIPLESATYTFAITGLFSQLDWQLFSDPAYTSSLVDCDTADHPDGLACTASLDAGSTYYLRVDELSGAPAKFRIAIGSGYWNEGTSASPVPLTVDDTARTSTVDVLGDSFYVVTPTVSGPHTIELDGHSETINGGTVSFPSDYGWTLYSDANFTTVIRDCHDFRQIRLYTADFEHCTATLSAGTPYYLKVHEFAAVPNRRFDLTVASRTGGGGTSDGTSGNPAVLWASPISSLSTFGSVAAGGTSFYSFQAAATTGSWRIDVAPTFPDSATFPGSNLTWGLFDDVNFTNEIAHCDAVKGIADQICQLPSLTAGATYYLRIQENDGVPQSSLEEFSVGLVGGFPSLTATSAASPAEIPLGATGITVQQAVTLSTGFYQFTTQAAGTYVVSAGLWDNVTPWLPASWDLYSDAAYGNRIAHCFGYNLPGAFSGATKCGVRLDPDTTYYLRVDTVRNSPTFDQSKLDLSVNLLN